MTVGTFVQPDFSTQSPTEVKTNITNAIAVFLRLAGAFAPHEQSSPNMTVAVDAGALLVVNTLTEVGAQSTGTITAPTTNPRYDRVVINSITGTVSVITGVEAASPVAPAITDGTLPVCCVHLTVGMTTITNAAIYDERMGVFSGVALTGNQSIDGIKTFTSFPITPSSLPTTAYQVANKSYVDSKSMGTGSVLISSSTSWTVPIGVTRIKITAGGGGSGGVDTQWGNAPGQGGKGKISVSYYTVTSGTVYTVSIGTGGNPSNNGNPTSVGALVTVNGGLVSEGNSIVTSENKNDVAQCYGDFCSGGASDAAGKPGFVYIEW